MADDLHWSTPRRFAEVGGHDDEPRPGVWQLVEW